MRKIVTAVALALATNARASASAPLADAVPIEAFAALPVIEDPELSPDGTKVAAKIAVNGRQLLVIRPLSGGKPGILSDQGPDINWWRWVSDDWLIVGTGDEQSIYGNDVYITRLVAVSADATKVHAIDPDYSGIEADNVIWVARDGSPKILLSRQTGIEREEDWYPSVFDVDVSTGRAKAIVSSITNVWDWAADGNGVVRYGVIYDDDGRKKGIMYAGPNGGHFQRIAFPKRGDDDSIPQPVVFRGDGNALAMDDRDGRDALYELSLPSFTLGQKVYGNDHYDLDGVYLNETQGDVSGISYVDKGPRVEWLDPKLKELQGGLDQTLGAGNARIISWSRNRDQLLVQVGTPSQAGALYYWDLARGATMVRIGWNSAILQNRTLSPVSTVQYKARDGVSIDAVLTLPRGREAKNLPLIVMPHGGPGARDSEEYDWWAQFLAEQGYAVVQPNYRGSTGYGKAFYDLGKGQWGLKMQDDLLDAITYLAGQGIADPKRVCIVGGSYGGYAAMRGAQRDGAYYRCAVSYAGISDLGAMLKYDRNLLGKEAAIYWKKQVPDFAAVSPRFHAAEFGAPILIAHGAADRRVPVKQSRMLVAELQKAGKPYEYLEQKLGDHHFSRQQDRLEFLQKLKAFLDKYDPA